jgi:GNAT superfamily N-acetyltransferase
LPSDGPVGQSRQEKLKDGTPVFVRPIEEGDSERERRFIEALSLESRRMRFLGEINSPSASLLEHFVHPDPEREAAYIALINVGGEEREIGVARYSMDSDGKACECAVTVADAWQKKGLASLLMQRLIDEAKRHGLARIYSLDLAENDGMRALALRFGFERATDPKDATQVIHTLRLQ